MRITQWCEIRSHALFTTRFKALCIEHQPHCKGCQGFAERNEFTCNTHSNVGNECPYKIYSANDAEKCWKRHSLLKRRTILRYQFCWTGSGLSSFSVVTSNKVGRLRSVNLTGKNTIIVVTLKVESLVYRALNHLRPEKLVVHPLFKTELTTHLGFSENSNTVGLMSLAVRTFEHLYVKDLFHSHVSKKKTTHG